MHKWAVSSSHCNPFRASLRSDVRGVFVILDMTRKGTLAVLSGKHHGSVKQVMSCVCVFDLCEPVCGSSVFVIE